MIQFPEKLEKQAANLFQRIMRRLVQEKARNAIQRAKTKAVVMDAVALDDQFDDFLAKLGLSEGDLTQAEIRSLERLAKSVDNFTRKEALRALAEMRQLAEDPFMLGLAQESLDREGITVDALRSYVRENMQIIKDASLAANRDIEKALAEGLSRGDTAKTIAKEIRKVADVSESYARFIARDQTGNLISTVSNRRYRAAGFPGYIWDATMDSRTRPPHAARLQPDPARARCDGRARFCVGDRLHRLCLCAGYGTAIYRGRRLSQYSGHRGGIAQPVCQLAGSIHLRTLWRRGRRGGDAGES